MMRYFALPFALLLAGAAHAAEPDFSESAASYEPATVVAGDVVHYTVTVRNSGGDSAYARVKTELPLGYFIRAIGDCEAARPDGSDRSLLWHEGAFAGGSVKQCRIDLLSRREAAGTLAPLATAITTLPAGYFRVEAAPELGSEAVANAIPLGPVLVTPAGLAVFAFLALGLGGWRALRQLRPAGRRRGAVLGAWLACTVAAGFLLFFASLAIGDARSYWAYRETSCTIFDSAIRTFQGTGKSARSSTYSPVFAVRYEAAGVETYSSAFPPPSAVNLGWIGWSQRALDSYPDGSVHACWFDPDDVKTVLLERGPGAAYLFALLPLAVLVLSLGVLGSALRSSARARRG